jgi:hypothetical protein
MMMTAIFYIIIHIRKGCGNHQARRRKEAKTPHA